MSVRNIILVLVAVAITAGTGLVARSWINSQRNEPVVAAAPPPDTKTYVLVADKPLPTGAFIKENRLTWQSWPDEKLHPSYLIKNKVNLKDLVGSVVRRPIAAGEPVTTGRIIKPGSRGFLAAVLRPGYRAVSLRVNATSSISGLVFPGDRVDIILTHDVSAGRVSETILTNVRILAIDQLTNDQVQAPKIGKHATFEVTPKQAEMVTVLSDMGRLSLSLRSLATDEADLKRLANSDELPFEAETEKGSTHTFTSEVSRLIRRGSLLNQDKVQVIRGGRTTELRFKKGKLVDSVSLDPDPKTPLVDDNPEVAASEQLAEETGQELPSSKFAKEQ
jgi:pilus assembly protein CpaB